MIIMITDIADHVRLAGDLEMAGNRTKPKEGRVDM